MVGYLTKVKIVINYIYINIFIIKKRRSQSIKEMQEKI
jgi:hypothetical protein